MIINPLNLIKIGIFIIIGLFLLLLFHLIIGFLGIQYFFGTLLAILTTILCIYLKFPLPLSIGFFFGVIYVLEWHWIFAVFLTLPGLIFLTPSKFKSTFNIKTFRTGYNFNKNSFKNNNKNETFKTNLKNGDIIDGEYKVINDDDKNK